jgi:hypothetical protein
MPDCDDEVNAIFESILGVRKKLKAILLEIIREDITNIMNDIQMATHLGKSHFSMDHQLNRLKLQVENLCQDYI